MICISVRVCVLWVLLVVLLCSWCVCFVSGWHCVFVSGVIVGCIVCFIG